MVDLGYLYDSGMATEKNHAEAATWYRHRSSRASLCSTPSPGKYRSARLFCPSGSPCSVACRFETAAEQGNTRARLKLGFLYASGRAGRVDLEAAYAWILAAKLAGDRRDEQYLAPLEKQLTAEPLTHAKQREQELLGNPVHYKVELALVR